MHFIDAVAKGSFSHIGGWYWSRAPWVFWNDDPPLVTLHHDILVGYAQFLETHKSRRSLGFLVEAWLEHYRHDLPGSSEAALMIRRMISHGGTRQAMEWAPAQAALGMFDHEHGPKRVGEAMAASGPEAERVLALARLEAKARSLGGFYRAAFHDFLGRIETDLRNRAMEVGRLQGLLHFIDRSTTWRSAPFVAHGLLRPWMNGPAILPPMRGLIYDYVIKAFGDPRRVGNTKWQAVDRDAEVVFKRWLAAVTLKEFFEIISDRADEQQWRYRNAFWTSFLEDGLIEDAWVLFGGGQSETRSSFGSDIACGHASGYSSRQAVILMRIGNLVAAEVSHSGSLRIWDVDDPRAPKLGLSDVQRNQLFEPCLKFGTSSDPYGLRHDGAADGVWQDRAARLINAQTGLKLSKARYMPRP
jgi:hypothetical protein